MSICLRNAVEADRDLLFRWANDDEVRNNSFSSTKISYEEHSKWFERMMKDPDCIQWILEENQQDIGQVRLKVNVDSVEISCSICAEKRGNGYGTLMFKLVENRIKEELPYIRKIIAKVKPNNTGSIKALENNCYKTVFQQFELQLD